MPCLPSVPPLACTGMRRVRFTAVVVASLVPASLAAQTPPSAPPTPKTPANVIAVQLEPTPLLVGTDVLTLDRLIAALQLRTRGRAMIVARTNDATAAGWHVTARRTGPQRLALSITRAAGESFVERDLPVHGRSAAEIAHTLALVIVEALTPVMPELADALPPKLTRPATRPTVDTPAAEPLVRRPRALRLHIGAAPGAIMLLPSQEIGAGLQLDVAMDSGWIAVKLDAALWSSVHASNDRIDITASHGALRLHTGVSRSHGVLWGALTVGPALRWVAMHASGLGVTKERGSYLNGGLVLAGAGGISYGRVRAGIDLRATRYLRFERFVVEGEGALLNMGRVTLEALACIGWEM